MHRVFSILQSSEENTELGGTHEVPLVDWKRRFDDDDYDDGSRCLNSGQEFQTLIN